MSFKNRLQSMQETWSKGRVAAPGVPDGIYKMQLQECQLRESQSSGKLMIYREHIIVEGEYTGEVVRDYIVLETEFGPRQLAEFVEKMAYEAPENAEDLEEIVAKIAADAPHYTAQVKKSKDSDMRNVRIREIISAGEAPAPAATTKAPGNGAAVVRKAATPGTVKTESPFSVGEVVEFTDEGKTMQGTINQVKATTCLVETDAGLFEVDTVSLTLTTGQEVETEAEAETTPEVDDQPDLIAFCQAHDLEVADDEARADLIAKITKLEWEKSEVTQEEKALLESIGATFYVQQAAKKAPAVVKKAAPAAVRKPTPAPARKAAVAKARR